MRNFSYPRWFLPLFVVVLGACSGSGSGQDVASNPTPDASGLPDAATVNEAGDGQALGDAWTWADGDATAADASGDTAVDAPPPVSLKLEAEDATLSGAVVATDQPGYSGTGFVDYINPSGDYIEWTASVPADGTYELSFAYALAQGDRPLEVRVNDAVVASSLSFPATGSFASWSMTSQLTVSLHAGANTIRTTAIGSSGANVDYLTINGTEPPKPPSTSCDLYGMYEISFPGTASNAPDDVGLTVTFHSPSGSNVVVPGFYDGNNEWKARFYCNELGNWTWTSTAPQMSVLAASGSFKVIPSSRRGKLRPHSKNSRYLMTDDGQTFVHINDTAYFLFDKNSTQWKEYIEQAVAHGVNSFRTMAFAPDSWDTVFLGGDKNKVNYVPLKVVDTRLKWVMKNYPDVYFQFGMLPGPPGYKQDDVVWHQLSSSQRHRLLTAIIARFGAYPSIFWIIRDDSDFISKPNNIAFVNDVGNFLKANDPFQSLRSAGSIRGQAFQFGNSGWATYIHIETQDTTPEAEMARYASTGLHVFDGEDRYESHHAPARPAIFFRRHMWSWLLSGGSASYGGIWAHIRPYDTATFTAAEYPGSGLPAGTYHLHGLDDVGFIRKFIEDNHVDLGDYQPNDGKVSGPGAPRQCQVMVSADSKRYLIYHPNAAGIGGDASLASGTAQLSIKALPAGSYAYTWMNASDGTTSSGSFNHSGGDRPFTAPWPGVDVALLVVPK